MRLVHPSGAYIRRAQLTDVDFIRDCIRDWPNGDWGRRQVEHIIDGNDRATVTIPPTQSVPNIVVVACLPNDTPVGFAHVSILVDPNSIGVDIHHIAIHPTYRGNGYFGPFAIMIAKFAKQVLGASGATFHVLTPATTVKNWADARGAVSVERVKRGELDPPAWFVTIAAPDITDPDMDTVTFDPNG